MKPTGISDLCAADAFFSSRSILSYAYRRSFVIPEILRFLLDSPKKTAIMKKSNQSKESIELEWIELFKAALIGIIQGITEWLPISSTGHMILADEWIQLNVSDRFREMFFVVIQLGSILAVAVLYFHRLNPFSPRKSTAEKRSTWELWMKVAVAAVPGVIAGLFLDDLLEELFYRPVPVAVMLIVYGVLFLVVERWNQRRQPRVESIEHLSYATALKIGLFQMLALIPGTSRSGSTILGAIVVGTARPVAAEFSFFLAVPMMLGASALKLLKLGVDYTMGEWSVLLVGTVFAFVTSLLVIRFLVDFVRRHDFRPFGWYRIGLGALVLLYFLLFR